MNKQQWLDIAEILDAFRVIPRTMLGGYAFFTVYYVIWIVGWYMGLPAVERTGTETAFISGTITAVLGGGTWFASSYNTSGRNWSGASGGG